MVVEDVEGASAASGEAVPADAQEGGAGVAGQEDFGAEEGEEAGGEGGTEGEEEAGKDRQGDEADESSASQEEEATRDGEEAGAPADDGEEAGAPADDGEEAGAPADDGDEAGAPADDGEEAGAPADDGEEAGAPAAGGVDDDQAGNGAPEGGAGGGVVIPSSAAVGIASPAAPASDTGVAEREATPSAPAPADPDAASLPADAEPGAEPKRPSALRRGVAAASASLVRGSLLEAAGLARTLLEGFRRSSPRAVRAALCAAEAAAFDHCGGASCLPLSMVTKARPSAPPSAALERLPFATPVPPELCEDVDTAKGVVSPLWVSPSAVIRMAGAMARASAPSSPGPGPAAGPPDDEGAIRRADTADLGAVPGRLLPPATRTVVLEALRLRWLLHQLRRPRRHDPVLAHLRPPRRGIQVGMTFNMARFDAVPVLQMQVSPAAARAITADKALAGPPGTPTATPPRSVSRRRLVGVEALPPVDRAVARAAAKTKGGRVPARPVLAVIGDKFLVLARPYNPGSAAADDASTGTSASHGTAADGHAAPGTPRAGTSARGQGLAPVSAVPLAAITSSGAPAPVQWWQRLVLPESGSGHAVCVAPLHACCATVCPGTPDTVAITVASVEPVALAVSVEAAAPAALGSSSPSGSRASRSRTASRLGFATGTDESSVLPAAEPRTMRPAEGGAAASAKGAAGGSAFEAAVASARINAAGGTEPRLWRMWLRARTPEDAAGIAERLQAASDAALDRRLTAWRDLSKLPSAWA